MIDKKKLEDYILHAGRVTVPGLQLKFSADYLTVRNVVSDLVKRGLLRQDNGLEFVPTGKEEPSFFERCRPAKMTEPISIFSPDRRSRDAAVLVKRMFDGLFGDEGRRDPATLRALLAYAADDGDEDDEDGEKDDDDLFEEIFDPFASEKGHGRYEALTRSELSIILPIVARTEREFLIPPRFEEMLDYSCTQLRFDRALTLALSTVERVLASLFAAVPVNAKIVKVEVSWSAAVFHVAAEGGDGERMRERLAHFAKGLFNHASAEGGGDRLKLIIPLPMNSRKQLTGESFARLVKYPRKRGLYFPVGRTYDGQDVLCDLASDDLLVTGDYGTEGTAFLHGALTAFTQRYSPERVRIFFASFKHPDILPYGEIPHHMAPYAITTAVGLNRVLNELKSLSTDPVRHRPQHLLLVLCGLPDPAAFPMQEFRERLTDIMKDNAKTGVHVIFIPNSMTENDLPASVSDLFGAKLCFRSAAAAQREEFAFKGNGSELYCPSSELLVGDGDAYYTVGGNSVRVQAVWGVGPKATVERLSGSDRPSEGYIIAEPPDDVVRLAPPEEVYLTGLKAVVESQNASLSLVQRTCSIGFNHAGKILEWMEKMGYITANERLLTRKVLLTRELFHDLYGDI